MTDTRAAGPTAPPRTAALEVLALTRRFGNSVAVDRVSFKVKQGHIFGLLGSNGAGKSTLIKMLTTLLPPSAGDALVAGFSILSAPAAVRGHMGYVPQMLSADGGLTARENLVFSSRLYGVPSGQRAARIADALQVMELEDAADRLVSTYSGGMIRRLELAQAMLHHPAVLFLDEPTIGLDPLARHAVWNRLRTLRGKFGMTVLLTTHDMEEAAKLCDEIAIMNAGHLVVQGNPGTLCSALSPTATLDDVFALYCSGSIAREGAFSETQETRATARQMN